MDNKKLGETVMFGAIARMEEHFGKFWGHGLTKDKCTENQLKIREIWEVCRKAILDHGNKEIRRANKNGGS